MVRPGARVLVSFVVILSAMGLAVASGHVRTDSRWSRDTVFPLKGGEWTDNFLPEQLLFSERVQSDAGDLILKYHETLNWKHTWTAQFDRSEFLHTEAISDTVRLAPVEASDEFHTTGVYTSAVLDAGRRVDWWFSNWA